MTEPATRRAGWGTPAKCSTCNDAGIVRHQGNTVSCPEASCWAYVGRRTRRALRREDRRHRTHHHPTIVGLLLAVLALIGSWAVVTAAAAIVVLIIRAVR